MTVEMLHHLGNFIVAGLAMHEGNGVQQDLQLTHIAAAEGILQYSIEGDVSSLIKRQAWPMPCHPAKRFSHGCRCGGRESGRQRGQAR